MSPTDNSAPRPSSHAHRTPPSLTVRELIELLKDEAPESPVIFASDYGDIGHTQQVFFLAGNLKEATVERSAYSDSGRALVDEREDGDDEEDDEGPAFLILK